MTRLPAHEIGQAALNELRRFGVRTDHVVRGGERLGVFYCEDRGSAAPSKVIYDRRHSAIAEAGDGDFDWQAIFVGAGWYHFTGITPALSDGCARLCARALEAAPKAGASISVDLNLPGKALEQRKGGGGDGGPRSRLRPDDRQRGGCGEGFRYPRWIPPP